MQEPTVLWVYRALLSRYGPRGWWPAKTPLEVVAGAILAQNTSWKNVEPAIANLRRERLLSLRTLAAAPRSRIEAAIRPSGYFRQKAERLRLVTRHVRSRHRSLARFLGQPVDALRIELLSLRGIGPETADCILCYAAMRPIFVVDTYARRLCERLPLEAGGSYEEVRGFFEERLPRTQPDLGEMHALIVEVGKRHCRKVPVCDGCPLRARCEYGRAGRQITYTAPPNGRSP